MNQNEIVSILQGIKKTRILVVGDVMLDRYWWGDASRLSPEAPVPVVALKKVSHSPGGAGNVAANIAGLGAGAILVGLTGNDSAGQELRETLRAYDISNEHLIVSDARPTTTKTRVLVHNQQIARVDEETRLPLDEAEEEMVAARVRELVPRADAVILSDYAKGCLTQRAIETVVTEAEKHGKFVVVDPKSRDLTKYNGATVITPNLIEALSAAGLEGGEERADEAAEIILLGTTVGSLLITLGEHGMKLYRRDLPPKYFPSMARQVFDVTGAGDTVVALLAAALGAGASIEVAISLANIGAGITVEKVGTSIVHTDELRSAVQGGVFRRSTEA